jgi:hypothetical protein
LGAGAKLLLPELLLQEASLLGAATPQARINKLAPRTVTVKRMFIMASPHCQITRRTDRLTRRVRAHAALRPCSAASLLAAQ